jgi:hypothetical protein
MKLSRSHWASWSLVSMSGLSGVGAFWGRTAQAAY